MLVFLVCAFICFQVGRLYELDVQSRKEKFTLMPTYNDANTVRYTLVNLKDTAGQPATLPADVVFAYEPTNGHAADSVTLSVVPGDPSSVDVRMATVGATGKVLATAASDPAFKVESDEFTISAGPAASGAFTESVVS